MHLAKLTAWIKGTAFFTLTVFTSLHLSAQDNSPYSRFGLGNIVRPQNVVNRAMGGVSAAYADRYSINFVNPASFSNILTTTFDLGGSVDIHNLKSNTTPEKYSSTNTNISYVQFAFPLSSKKMMDKNRYWALAIGLRPVTRISYKIGEYKRIPNIDSAVTIYEGSGGVNQASISTALQIKRFSAGVTLGYNFGNRNYGTKLSLINDSVVYYRGNSATQTSFNGFSVTAGLQYELPSPKGNWRFGAYATLSYNLNADKSNINETFTQGIDDQTFTIDTVDYKSGVEGTIQMPVNYGLGFTFTDKSNHWTVGADYEASQWGEYRFYKQSEGLVNSYRLKAGAQYYPATSSTVASKYFRFVKYRFGMFYGTDPIKISKERKEFGVTAGAGFPLTSFQRIRFGDFATLNTGVEFNVLGNNKSGSIRENILRFNVGIAMNARWFQKRKYD